MPCDAQTLINTAVANGYDKLSDRDLKEALVAAACAGGGGGGSVQIITGSAANPNIAGVIPADPTKAALYYQNGGGTLFQWDVPGQTWV